MAGNYKVDIFSLMSRLARGDKEVWNSFTEEEKKSVSPLVIMRFFSGTSNAGQILLLNHIVNPLVYSLGKHPDLLFKLIAACLNEVKRAGAQKIENSWLAQKKSAGSKKMSVQVIQMYYNYSSREAYQYLPLLNKNDIVEMAEQLGWDKPEIVKLKREL